MGLEMGVLHPLGNVFRLVDPVRRGEARLDVADLAMRLRREVRVRMERRGVGAGGGRAAIGRIVDERRARPQGFLRVEHRRAQPVFHAQGPHAGCRRRLALGDHRGDALADKADDGIEHPRVGGGVPRVLVAPGGEAGPRRILVRQHGDDARQSQRRRAVDRDDLGMRMGRAQHLEMQETRQCVVEGVGGPP